MIYVLVPAHNEAPTVGLLLWKVRQFFTSFNREYQLIVVNDGSDDATDEILAPYTRALPLTLLTHRKRQGYARSLEALLREAVRRSDRPRRDLVITLQADFSESPEDVLELLKRLEGGADIVVADRRNRRGASRIEALARRLLPVLVRRRLGIVGADDVVGTMRGYRLAVIERLVRDAGTQPFLGRQGWAADLELLARAARHARTIASVAVTSPRPESARPSRRSTLREAWRTWREAVALTGLPMPVLQPFEAVEPPHQHVTAPHGRSERGAESDRHRGERRDRPGREGRRHRQDRRPQGDKGQRQRAPRGADRQPPAEAPAPRPDAAAPRDANPQPPVTAPVGSDADGGARRKRRRRGRGRGRGRGQNPGPGTGPGPNGQAQQPPVPPPAA